MNANTQPLAVIRLSGLHLDTLGHYFGALGLLRLSARKWPTVKGCWRDGVFCLVGGPQDFAELEAFLLAIGTNGHWTPYVINRPQNASTDSQEKKGKDITLWIAQATGETEAVLGLAHVVGGDRRDFNPVFGKGGNAGNRNFSKGWTRAREAVVAKEATSKSKKNKKKVEQQTLLPVEKEAPAKEMPPAAKQDLSAFFNGETCSLLSDYGAACWFSAANKIYNFSPDKPFRDGQITPWAMLLACEAFPLLVGGTSRQIGSQRQGNGAFPFVTQGAAPVNEKETGTVEGEFWAPVWGNPLTISEVSALFKRGRAEANGRGAITSAAFAAAIIQKGTDAGLNEFRRFSLLHTTSAQTFESRLASVHPLYRVIDIGQAEAISKIVRFRDALPREYKKGKTWIYRGLQGPIDHSLVRLAAMGKNDEQRVESSWQVLDAVFGSLEKTANNKTHREREPSLALLPVAWAVSLLENTHEISPEARVALAFATLQAETPQKAPAAGSKRPQTAPLIAYRVGVEPAWKNNWRTIKIAKNEPLRVVWSQRGLAENICAVIRRRVAVESEAGAEPPCNARLTLSLADVLAFLNNELDDVLIERWLTRFMLFDWSFISHQERDSLSGILINNTSENPLRSEEILYTFFRPLFHAYTFAQLAQNDAAGKQPQPTVNVLRQLVALLERGDCAAAHRAAVNRYKSLLQPTADFGENTFTISEPRRLLATLVLPASPKRIAKAFARWAIPANDQHAR